MSGTPTPVQPPETSIVDSKKIQQCPDRVLTARHYVRDECRHRRRRRLLVVLGCITAFVVGHSLPFVVLPR